MVLSLQDFIISVGLSSCGVLRITLLHKKTVNHMVILDKGMEISGMSCNFKHVKKKFSA